MLLILNPSRSPLPAVEELSSASSYATSTWISWFLSSKGNEYFCEVDEDYILDRFNLTGLNAEVQHYSQALDLVTDALEDELDQETRDHIEAQGRLLYGLVHARYIITSRGLNKMMEKYKRSDFGRCPRVLCYSQPLLPLGLSDLPFQKAVKLYCPRCEDIYSPKSSRHGTIDGAFFGSSFPHLLVRRDGGQAGGQTFRVLTSYFLSPPAPRQFMVYPHMLPSKSPSSQSPFSLPPPSNHPAAQVIQQQQNITQNDSPAPGETGAAGAATDGNESPMNVDAHAGSGSSASGVNNGGTQRQQQQQQQQQSAPLSSSSRSGPPIHKGVERYKPRIFGFPVHEVAVLHRWQERVAEQMVTGPAPPAVPSSSSAGATARRTSSTAATAGTQGQSAAQASSNTR